MKKKEQFNLALWDRLQKDNIPHTFETREGKQVNKIINFDTEHFPIHGVNDGIVKSWTRDGVYGGHSDELDLFIVWEEDQLMLEAKLYISVSGEFTLDYETAMYPHFNLIAIKQVSIPYTKGEGLGDGK